MTFASLATLDNDRPDIDILPGTLAASGRTVTTVEVAKGASDMILTDDNFCSIVKAVEKGRGIYSGIEKFVSFIMSVHFAEVLQIFLCVVSGLPIMREQIGRASCRERV